MPLCPLVTCAVRVTLHNMADSHYGGYTRFELELEVSRNEKASPPGPKRLGIIMSAQGV